MIISNRTAQRTSLKELQHIQVELHFTGAKTVIILGQ